MTSRRCGAILAYHRVGDLRPDTWSLCVAPERFRAHLALLAARYRPLPLAELAAAASANALPAGAVAVTLDDGTLDHLTIAAPLLDEARVPATLFVSSARLDEEREYWWDTLERIAAAPTLPPSLQIAEREFSMVREADRAGALQALHALLLPLPVDEREQRMAEIVAWSGLALPPRPSHRAMTGDEIRRAARRCTVGAHGANHLWLPAQSPATRRAEIAGSKSALEALLDRAVDAFAYPFGARDDATVGEVRTAGYSCAVTVEQRAVQPDDAPLLLPRFDAGTLDTAALAALLDAAAPLDA